MSQPLFVAITFPSDFDTAAVARTLVSEHLAACVNMVAGAQSFYRWNGVLEEEGETLLFIKTTQARFPDLLARVKAVHPAEVPGVEAWPITDGEPAFLKWIEKEVG